MRFRNFGISLSLLIVVAILLALFVWPTPYEYTVEWQSTKAGGVVRVYLRTSRQTGNVESRLANSGWEPGHLIID